MPLQVISDVLGLPAPVIRADLRPWILAESINLGSSTLMLVYHSVVLQETDPMYSDVADMLFRSKRIEILFPRTLMDEPDMMFGKGITAVYLLHDDLSDPMLDPRARIIADVLASWGETVPLDDLPRQLRERLGQRLNQPISERL